MQGIGRAATTAIAAGLAVATAATVGFAVHSLHSLQAFSSFEKGMNEVFTLLPDITEDAMSQMTKDVQLFSSEMKVLPDEVIPALYQAISAGVPKDNVFDFLEIAQKAAIGGVSDLTTAVDGISSAVNAYGEDVLDATTASDQMFTAVRLGKTTFSELAATMSGVTSIAASTGVSFGEVMAATAAMTAQGVKTPIAMTRMRGLLSELSDSGTDVGKVFSETAGVSFREFMAQGNNLSQALGVLEQASATTGKPINEMFGNIRAGMGVLALTGDQAGRFSDALDEMANSAGATDAAFEIMDRGISRTMDGIKTNFRNVAISIGGMIEPLVLPGLEDMSSLLSMISTILIDPAMAGGALEQLPPHLRIIGTFLSRGVRAIQAFFFELENGRGLLLAVQVALFELTGISFGGMTGSIKDMLKAIQSVIDPIVAWVNENIELESVLIAVGLVIASVVVPALLGIATAIAVPLAIFGAFVLAIQFMREAWEIFTDVLDLGGTPILAIAEILDQLIDPTGQLSQAWMDFVRTIEDDVIPAAQSVIDIVIAVVGEFVNFVNEHPAVIVALGALGFAFGGAAALAWIAQAAFLALKTVGIALGGGLAVILSPAVLLALAIAGILIAADSIYPGGLVALFEDATVAAEQLATLGFIALGEAAKTVEDSIRAIGEIIDLVMGKFNTMVEQVTGGVAGSAGRSPIEAQANLITGQGSLQDVNAAMLQSAAISAIPIFGPLLAQQQLQAGFTPAIQSLRGGAGGRNVFAGQQYLTHGIDSGREIFVPGINGSVQNQAQRTEDEGRPINVTINVSGVPTKQQANQVGYKMVNALRANGVQVEDSLT